MRTSLGVSAGSEVVCSALLTTTPNGAQTIEYRVISADDQANTDLGDLVASSIELMTTQVLQDKVAPRGIAVAYRSREQTHAIRSAVGTRRRDLQLVPESAAALTYLRSTGEVAQHKTIAVFDLGASGLTVTVLDQVDGTVLESQRTTDISGNAIDELVAGHLVSEHYAHGERPSRASLTARARAAKEHLSTNDAVTVDHVDGLPLELTRADFEKLIGILLHEAAAFAGGVFAEAAHQPEIIAVVGGGANIPIVRTGLGDKLGIPVLAIDEPEAVIAKGAALLADSSGPLSYPIVSMGSDAPIGTFTKVVGALVGAFVVVGLVIGYGVQALTPTPDDVSGVSPAGTSNAQTTTPEATAGPSIAMPIETETGATFPTYESQGPAAVATGTERGYTYEQQPVSSRPAESSTTTTTTTTRTPAPTLRPAPDLPLIPWPEIEQWLPRPPEGPPPASVTEPSTEEAPNTDSQVPAPTQPEAQTYAPRENSEPNPPVVTTTPSDAPVPPPARLGSGSAG
ncbi:Hsp70 family protein [Antrihabitans sp. YC3-6]|uniref:Hsp70 family protein n=1 Tax=Antrihabitans stalagmiti TaxID=2799499 RepID=A0A934NNQ6_9NOCA|nr:Hsp70 family protein [Antrihabitans stalagmiti]MBJ8338547.1 Hsp70 family protein [Antrihabitans stalagmiti]